MKNITQYFTDAVKSCETSPFDSSGSMKKTEKSESNSNKKRSRVKIKISRTNSKGRICNIIENKNDLIDKTPSPFSKINNEKSKDNQTPNTSYLSNASLTSDCNDILNQVDLNGSEMLKEVDENCVKTSNKKAKSWIRIGESIPKDFMKKSKPNKNTLKNDSQFNNKLKINDSSNKSEKDIMEVTIDSSDSEKEESNAFKVLMNRNKSALPVQLSPQKSDTSAKKTNESREKLKEQKEKLVALADKKGYSKRKLAEMEEGEKIEKDIQNRIKLFKGDVKKDECSVTTIINHKQSSSNILNYFSKIPTKEMEKEGASTTFIIKADVHMSETSVINTSLTPTLRKASSNKLNTTSNAVLSKINDIDVIASEILSTPINKYEDQQSLHRNKPRWSMRIKLQSYNDQDSLHDKIECNTNENTMECNEDVLFSPRSKAKMKEHIRKSDISNAVTTEAKLDIKHKTNKDNVKNQNDQYPVKTKALKREKSRNRVEEKQKDLNILKSSNTKVEDLDNKPKQKNASKSTKVGNNIQDEVTHSGKIVCLNENKNDILNINMNDIVTIESENLCCDIIEDNVLKRKTNAKLAPLFIKQRKPDLAVLAARRLFLQSDITDSDNKNVDKKVNTHNLSILPFPTVGHITQISDVSNVDELSCYKIPIKFQDKGITCINKTDYKYVIDLSKSVAQRKAKTNKLIEADIEETLTEIESRCANVRELWRTILSVTKDQSNRKSSPQRKNRKAKFEKKEAITNEESDSHNTIWTHKYKPRTTQEIVGNEEAVAKLKDWLNGWQVSLTKNDDSSGDEFYSSDCSYSSSNENNQVAVLLGPYGSGKSASVYAVAEEFGYSVLEVNASSKRTGKKLLKELEEATKSHRIKKEKHKIFRPSVEKSTVKKIPQNSLILLEDVDLIFEEDEGFVSAAYQLASNTKRPIVMTCRDVCNQLSKMAPQQNRIYFQNATGNKVSALLELISLAETGCRLPHNCLMELLQMGDLRKALLQLQYLLFESSQTFKSLNMSISLWQDMRYYLYKPVIKTTKKQRIRKSINAKKRTDSIDVLDKITSSLDSLSLLSSLIDVEDPALNLLNVKEQPSLSLIEDTTLYSFLHSINLEIAEWINRKIVCKEELNESEVIRHRNNNTLKKQLNKGVDSALSRVTSLVLDNHIISVDYLPFVRAICRAESVRNTLNNKRGNRFYHYLHNLNIPTASVKPNILAAACKMLQEKIEKDVDTSIGDKYDLTVD